MRSVVRRFHGTREIERVQEFTERSERKLQRANVNVERFSTETDEDLYLVIHSSHRRSPDKTLNRNWRATSLPATRRARVTREERLELSLGQAKRYHRRRTGKVAGNPQRRNNLGLLVRHRRRHCDAGFAIKYDDRCVLGLRRES